MASIVKADDPDVLAAAECLAIVEAFCRRQGASAEQEARLVEQAKLAIEELKRQGRSPRALAAALRLEARLTSWGRLCSAESWASLVADFEWTFREG